MVSDSAATRTRVRARAKGPGRTGRTSPPLGELLLFQQLRQLVQGLQIILLQLANMDAGDGRPVVEMAWFYRCKPQPDVTPEQDCPMRFWKDTSGRYLDRNHAGILIIHAIDRADPAAAR